ncbi:MAG: hypothetical protein FD143_820 [Ignavibacteria bacterium]|nr:MAG: hypothetical protein FD143_820 [Ignavibacteria bacterium]KAF0160594.1 MAG: hypothetical protein FD188_1586 [Ignavibacteria bacterium]
MKLLPKLVSPILVGLIILVMYLFYFSPFKGLGAFNDYDPNSHVQKEIVVKVVQDLGVQQTADGSKITFYAEDKNGVRMPIEISSEFKSIVDGSEIITMTGHICGGRYEAVNIEL